ncbi:MAG: DUF2330 domain-containing protein [Verrucomicrobiota bacterium]|jgi:hypothetical protein
MTIKLAIAGRFCYLTGMNPKTMGLLVGCLLFASASAFGDGCVIPPTPFAKVEIPDQRALIHFADGTETLVIDTSFHGEGTNFAWVIPVPALPKIEAATVGFFPTLQTVFRPEVVHNVPALFWLPILVGLFLYSVLRLKRQGRSIAGILLLWLLLICFWSMLLPAGSGLSVAVSANQQVHVFARKVVGIYETATLKSEDGTALIEWLNKNGFATPTSFLPAIRAYAKEGWYFTASKIRLDASLHEAARAHPLALTFKTRNPVYPLRLTAIGNNHCRIDLYVFGPDCATASGFAVERCAKPVYPVSKNDDRPQYRDNGDLRIRHPLLRALVDQSPVATKLTAQLSSEEMQRDAYIAWTPFQEKRLTYFSPHGAAMLASNVSLSLIAMALLVWYCTATSQRAWARQCWRCCRIAILLGVILWCPIYLLVPKISVSLASFKDAGMWHLHEIPWALENRWGKAATNMPDLAWVRQQLREGSPERGDLQITVQTNAIFGLPWREEDSPGNYTLRQTAEGIDFISYDIDGAAIVTPLFPPPDENSPRAKRHN